MKKSTFFKGALAVAAIGVGALCIPAGAAILAYIGVSAAATTASAVLWGGGGAIAGGLGGGLIGLGVAAPGLVHFFKKGKKALGKQSSDFFSGTGAFSTAGFPKMDLKADFGTAGLNATQKAVPSAARRNAPRFTR